MPQHSLRGASELLRVGSVFNKSLVRLFSEIGLAINPFASGQRSGIRRTAIHNLELGLLLLTMAAMTYGIWLRRADLIRLDHDGRIADPMLVSGYAAALIAIWLSLAIDGRYLAAVRQIISDRVLSIEPEEIERNHNFIQVFCKYARWGVAIIVLLVMVPTYLIYYEGVPAGSIGFEYFASAWLLGAIAGHRLGSIVAYGHLGVVLFVNRAQFHLVPDHPDDTGGALALGRFLTIQAMLVLIPVLWLTFWCLNFDRFPQYEGWRYGFYLLLLIALTSLYLGVLSPAYVISIRFQEARNRLQDAFSGQIEHEIEMIKSRMKSEIKVEEFSQSSLKLKERIEFREKIHRLPMFPMRAASAGFISLASILPIISWFVDLFLPEVSSVLRLMFDAGRLVGFWS